jgi:hypothetical protein
MMAFSHRKQNGTRMTARDLLRGWATKLAREQHHIATTGLDDPIQSVRGRLLQSTGTLHLYELTLPQPRVVEIDTPVTIVPPDELEPTEGIVLRNTSHIMLVQTFDFIGQSFASATVIPDRAGFLTIATQRLTDMTTRIDAYHFGPADRLASLLESVSEDEGHGGVTVGSSILTTVWMDDQTLRHQRLASLAIELIKGNKRILVVSRDHDTADVLVGTIARAMKAAGLTYKTWISRYEIALSQHAAGIAIHELGFEAQMHQFYAKARAEKAALRKKYDRFRELTPLLAYKRQKQKDLDEVRLLEWRLLTQLSDLQAKTKEVDATLTEYENLPLLRRLGMQAVGKNVESLQQYRALYESQIVELMKEVDVARARIAELVPEAAVPKDIRPEFEDLKEDIVRLGGTKKIRELLAAEEDTNRQAFIQNRRLVVTTASRVIGDPLFRRVRFDVLLVDEAPWIPAAPLLAAAGLVRERIIVSGNQRNIAASGVWALTDTPVSVRR